MRKTINILHQTFVWRCFLLITISIIFSCTQNTPDQPHTSIKKNTQRPPVTITGKAPVVVLLDTCTSPRNIAIPQKMGDSYIIKSEDGSKTIQLLPPEIKSAGFFVSMQNFTTRNGLAHNAVIAGCIDKNGNVWFCTWGGGVSRYDGKSFTNYTIAQGLASDNVISILQDKSGNLWFGTYGGGVSRYDGKSFRSYTTAHGLAGNIVWTIIEDKTGNLWFGTFGGGISRYDGKSFTNYTKAQGLTGDGVSRILEDKFGNIWIGTWGAGVSCYDGRSFINYTAADGLANNMVACIFEDKNGNIWFGNDSGKISCLDSKKKKPGRKPNFMNYTITEAPPNRGVNTIIEDKNGNLWFGTGDGVFRLDWNKKANPGKESFTSIIAQEGLPNNNINSILEDKSGNIWFGSDNGGVSLLDVHSKFLTSLTMNGGLLSNKISSIFEDKGQNLWFGTLTGGLLRLTPDSKSLLKYSTSQGLPDNAITNIFQDKSANLWITTLLHDGASRISSDGKFLTRYTTAQGLSRGRISKIFEDKRGNLWFGSLGGGVSRLSSDSKSFTVYTTDQGLPDNVITGIIEDKKGNIWLGTHKGVCRLGPDGKSVTNYTVKQGLTNNKVRSILEDKNGNIWFGTDGGGVSRYDGKSFVSFTTGQGLSDDNVIDVVMDKEGTIWLGTNKGFTAIKGFVQIKDTLSASQKNLQPSNELSNAELERYNFKPVFEIYNVRTGYPIEMITSNLLVTREGMIWAGTGSREKTIRFDYSSIHKNPNPPDVFIQSIKVNNEAISWYDLSYDKEKTDSFTTAPNIIEEVRLFGKVLSEEQRDTMRKKFGGIRYDSISRFYPVPVNLVLPYAHNNITFDFTAIEPARPGFVHYQYMMEGYENEWSPVSDKTSATYGNVHEGSYTFKLKAQSPDGVWSRPLTYIFKVLPPWYRTWWAYIVYVSGFAAFIWIFVSYRSRRLKAENLLLEKKVIKRTQELEQSLNERYELNKKVESQQALLNERLRISRELHDDIGSTLGSISIYSEVAKKRTEKNENTNEVLSKIGFTSRELIEKMSDIVWSLNPSNEGFEQLQNRMMAFAAIMLAPRNIPYDFTAGEALKKLQLTGEQRKNIFLIFKEALYNIVKYADCKTVSIKLFEENKDLIMIINDDGKGFDISQTTLNEILPSGDYLGGNGIKNMYARADVMKATLFIHSKINEGTTVQLTVPLFN